MRSPIPTRVLPFALAALSLGCAFGRTSSGVRSTPEKYLMSAGARVPSAVPTDGRDVQPEMPALYGRDGSPVATQRPGTVDTGRRPTHELDSPDGSRMYILELYQQAIDEKEALEVEVTALTAALEKANDAIEQYEQRLTDLQAMLENRNAEVARLRTEGDELANRLVTSQIRRLEAEKLLLEAKLEWIRLQKLLARRSGSSEDGERP